MQAAHNGARPFQTTATSLQTSTHPQSLEKLGSEIEAKEKQVGGVGLDKVGENKHRAFCLTGLPSLIPHTIDTDYVE